MLRRPCINARFGCGRTFRLDRVGESDVILCGRCWRRADPSLRERSKAANRACRAVFRKWDRARFRTGKAYVRAGTALWIESQNAFLAVILDARAKLAMGVRG